MFPAILHESLWRGRPPTSGMVAMEAPRAEIGGEAVPIIDAERYPIHRPVSPAYARLVETCRHELATAHAVNLPGFVLEAVRVAMVGELAPLSALALRNREQSGYHLAHLTPDQLEEIREAFNRTSLL